MIFLSLYRWCVDWKVSRICDLNQRDKNKYRQVTYVTKIIRIKLFLK